MNTSLIPERLFPEQPEWRLYGHQHVQRYRFALERLKNSRVLDAACGCGYGSFILANNGANRVTGVDIDPESISYSNRIYKMDGISFVVGNALTLPSESGQMDAVVSYETIEHLGRPIEFLTEINRVLRPGGTLILSAPNALAHGRAIPPKPNPYHLSEPVYAELREWLEPHFVIEEEWEQSFVVPSATFDQETCRLQREALAPSGILGVLRRLENLARRVIGRTPLGQRPSPRPADTGAISLLHVSTDIVPLLPERRSVCDTFLFVAKRKAH
ncbi:MAG: class I SAM-dependent methyltransferase [Sulfuricellaceae bacterium]|nr:class I SAM-dependent methyltransferase [Sulfuricellaceae bacterium]